MGVSVCLWCQTMKSEENRLYLIAARPAGGLELLKRRNESYPLEMNSQFCVEYTFQKQRCGWGTERHQGSKVQDRSLFSFRSSIMSSITVSSVFLGLRWQAAVGFLLMWAAWGITIVSFDLYLEGKVSYFCWSPISYCTLAWPRNWRQHGAT